MYNAKNQKLQKLIGDIINNKDLIRLSATKIIAEGV